jgi:poly [ADP-ribose] polymerase 2/3/4
VRDINDASRLIGDAFGSTLLDDPLSECYKKLGCSIGAVAEGSEDYKMVLKYLEKTYEPVKVEDVVRYRILLPVDPSSSIHPRNKHVQRLLDTSVQVYGVSVERIYAVESSAFPSYEEIRNLPNKILLWCGTFNPFFFFFLLFMESWLLTMHACMIQWHAQHDTNTSMYVTLVLV